MLFISLANILSSVGKMNSSRVDRGWARLATCVSSLIQHFGWQFGNLVNTKLRIEMMKKQLFFYTGYVVRDTQAPDIYVSACHLKKR